MSACQMTCSATAPKSNAVALSSRASKVFAKAMPLNGAFRHLQMRFESADAFFTIPYSVRFRSILFLLASPAARRQNARHSAPFVTKAQKKEMMMWEALREGLDEEMERDPTVCLMGEDVGHYGGSYKVSYGLYKKYGEMRLLDTPICENGFMGMGVGAAMTGLRPIVEGMNMGFLLLAFNQISNNCGMLHYTSGGQYKVPMVIRGPGGVGRQLGAEHSQRLESYFQSIPGVQLVACSTVKNAKALLKSAIRSDNPIIFFEHVLLYNVKGEVEGPEYCQSLERAEVVREGTDVTIFCYSRMRYVVMQAVGQLEKEGFNPEVVDLISLKPFDMETISKSIMKTRRAIIVEECMKTGGIGASLSAVIHESLFNELDHEVVRLSSQDVPTSYAYELEAATIVQPEKVVEAVHRVCGSPVLS
jgi:pyruvate dehydrogenase E1 component beta subunit